MFGFKKRKAKETPIQVAPTETDAQTNPIEANVRGQTLTSNACGGTNPDLPPQTAFREAPETPIPTENEPVRDKRDCRIKIRFTPKELADVKRKAKEAGTDCSKYIRGKLNSAELIPTPQPDIQALRAPFIGVGRHLDGILVRARMNGFVDIPDLEKAMDEYRKSYHALSVYYDRKGLIFREEAGE